MNLRQMEVFRAVMASGGINSAAQTLYVSPPAVSKVLAQLAKVTGLVLFEKVKGRLIPTPEAQALYEEICVLWSGVDHVMAVAKQLREPAQPRLKLACTSNVAPYLVSRTMAKLYEKFPRLQCQLQVAAPELVNQLLLDRSFDFGVALEPSDHPNLEVVRSYRCGLACVMRQDHVLARSSVLRAEDLLGWRVIAAPTSTPFGAVIRRSFGPWLAQMQIDLECSSSTTACWFAQAGVGVAVVDQAGIAGDLLAGLAVRPFVGDETMAINVVRNRYKPMSVAEKAFVAEFDVIWHFAQRTWQA